MRARVSKAKEFFLEDGENLMTGWRLMFTEISCHVVTWPSVLSQTQRLKRQLDFTIASNNASLDSVQIAEILGRLARLRTYLFSPG